ncbi:hypothetical protein TGRH88_074590 [Toxoplasma gondii]|uniref:Uncharacterized protein n=1 Tax=Toxoplasma gondii TaxID=5811 RepID=A0A7J6K497_TOXGO|nr:hypothetical protein TGRH88_074590 [Toxoplasma gondii]
MCWTVCSPCTSDEPKKSRACIRVSLNAHVPFCALATSVHKAEERRRRIESRLFLFPFNVPDCFLSPARRLFG